MDVRRLPTKRSERLSGRNCPKVVANDRKHRRCKLNLHPKGLGKCQPVSCLHPLNREVVSSFRPNQRRSTTNHSMTLIRSTNSGREAVGTKVFTALRRAPTIRACCNSNPYVYITTFTVQKEARAARTIWNYTRILPIFFVNAKQAHHSKRHVLKNDVERVNKCKNDTKYEQCVQWAPYLYKPKDQNVLEFNP